jgi:hypothetical protein
MSALVRIVDSRPRSAGRSYRSDHTLFPMRPDRSSRLLVVSTRRNLRDPMFSSDTKQADRCTQNFIDLVPTKDKMPIRWSVLWILPFTQLHHVEIEISAYERYDAFSHQSISTNDQSLQAQKLAITLTMSYQIHRTLVAAESVACLEWSLIRQMQIRFRSPFRLTKLAGTHRQDPFRAFACRCEVFLVAMPITSNNSGFTRPTRLVNRTILSANTQ